MVFWREMAAGTLRGKVIGDKMTSSSRSASDVSVEEASLRPTVTSSALTVVEAARRAARLGPEDDATHNGSRGVARQRRRSECMETEGRGRGRKGCWRVAAAAPDA